MDFKQLIKSRPYDFLRTNRHLGDNIVLLTLGGSHAYGTATPTSDVDVRGCALNSKREILLGRPFEQVIDNATDTTVYSFAKLIGLLSSCNPNTIEMLGCRPEHYLILTGPGMEMVENAHMFLSRRAAQSFGGYAVHQLHRLENKSVRTVSPERQEQHILESVRNMGGYIREKYGLGAGDALRFYIDASEKAEMETEIFCDITLNHFPLRDYKGMMTEYQEVLKSYSRIGRRNESAILRGQIGKHMMHLIRLYLMCIDILEKERIVTYREAEHDMLMEIRNGKYLTETNDILPAFFDLVTDLRKRMKYAEENTSLPETADRKEIDEFVYAVHDAVIKRERDESLQN